MSKNLLLVSFLSTNYQALKAHWEKYSTLFQNGKRGSDRAFTEKLGGEVCILDWDTKEVIWRMEVDSPSGLYKEENLLYVNSISLGKLLVIDMQNKHIIHEINNPYFNKPHSLVKTKRGFLITSTGLDCIIEIDNTGQVLYEIFLTENGYPTDQFGKKRSIDKTINHQQLNYPSLSQTTHVNYARYLNPDETMIGATLFHPGQLISINTRTNETQILMDKLNHPHGFKDFSDSYYLVCDTDNNQVLKIRKSDFFVDERIKGDFSWVQDAIQLNGAMFIADADHHKIHKINLNNKEDIDSYEFPSSHRIYEIYPVTTL